MLSQQVNLMMQYYKANMEIDKTASSILFHRGIFPSDDFKVTKKYGMNVIATVNDELKEYISKIFDQLAGKTIRGFKQDSTNMCIFRMGKGGKHL
jgi:hypothetical protein